MSSAILYMQQLQLTHHRFWLCGELSARSGTNQAQRLPKAASTARRLRASPLLFHWSRVLRRRRRLDGHIGQPRLRREHTPPHEHASSHAPRHGETRLRRARRPQKAPRRDRRGILSQSTIDPTRAQRAKAAPSRGARPARARGRRGGLLSMLSMNGGVKVRIPAKPRTRTPHPA